MRARRPLPFRLVVLRWKTHFWVGLCLLALGEGNLTPREAAAGDIEVSVARGCYDQPISLRLSTSLPDALIRYTLDGSEPDLVHGQTWVEPFSITNTTILRAAAFQTPGRVSAVVTHSYLFLDEVLRQPPNPPGFPTGPKAWKGQPSCYAMDPRIVDAAEYRGRLQESLKSLPIVSVVCRREDLFGAAGGIYVNSLNRGAAWERACSVEWISPEGAPGFQIDCGIRVQGNFNRIPVKSPKHSFRLLFKEKYGASKLRFPVFPDSPVTKFDTLVLRADYNNSWVHWDPTHQARAQRIRDSWMKDSHRAMGWTAAHNRYVHLFLNGLYWGVYDATERPDGSFAAAHMGGRREDYDVINEFQVKDGSSAAFRALQGIRSFSRPSAYEQVQRQLDLTQFIDYLLLNYYAGNQDWGENKNWYAIRRNNPPGPFQFFVWDGEHVLQRVTDDTVNQPFEVPMRLAENLREHPEFRQAFAERVKKHLLGNGALTPAATAARWKKRAAEIDLAIIAESARWGAHRRNPPYTRDKDWLAEQRRLLQKYFPKRTDIVLEQLRAAGLYQPESTGVP